MPDASRLWSELGAIAPTELASACLQLHWAAQVVGAAADALGEKKADDSHTNLFWDPPGQEFLSRTLPGGRELGLTPTTLQLVLIDGESASRFPLAGRTLADALQWAARELGVDALAVRDYDMPDHEVASGGVFRAPSDESAEVGRYFAAASATLTAIAADDPRATEVAIWPHHFDVGAIVFVGEGDLHKAPQIGIGMSPGDGTIAEPYFYVTPWPIADGARAGDLLAGKWQTDGFTGVVLPATEIVAMPPGERGERVSAALRHAVTDCERLISENQS